MISIIDYGVGNISAFLNLFKREAIPARRVTVSSELENCEKIILPGVGSYDHAISKFNDSGMKGAVEKLVFQNKIPLLGICVGMQMLANSSSEGNLPGLGWVPGVVKRFDPMTIPFPTKFPHMGWNKVEPARENKLFRNLEKDSEFYFLHSYYFECLDESTILGLSNYGLKFASVINKDNIYGIQCHPEKSHTAGIQFLKNFAAI
jgi:glutamine amidotransferase